MAQTKVRSASMARTRSIAFVGLTIAIEAVSAWVTIPIGPIPFTLQMFAFTFAIVVLTPKQAVAAVAGYLLLGALGVPVFSGMRGGMGVLMGTSGGYLWGYLFGTAAAVLLLHVVRANTEWEVSRRQAAIDPAAAAALTPVQKAVRFLRISGIEVLAGVLFTAIAYVCGWAQYMAVAHVGPAAAFLACVAPFVAVDLIKIVAAVMCARAVKMAVC